MMVVGVSGLVLLVVDELNMIEQFALLHEFAQSKPVEILVGNETAVIEIVHGVEKGSELHFQFTHLFVGEQMRGVGELLQFLVKLLSPHTAFLRLLLELAVISPCTKQTQGSNQ